MFCSSELWDSELTWNTTNPDFTYCFHQSVLTYIPSLVLLIGLPFQINLCKTSRNSKIPWTLLNITKSLLTLGLIALPTIDLVWMIWFNADDHVVQPVTFVADVVRIITYTTVLLAQLSTQKYGLVTSGPLFIYWFVATCCAIPTFRSIIVGNQFHFNNYYIPFITFSLQFPVMVAMLFLNFFSDAKPKYIDLDEQVDNLSPERFASFPSKMFFSWFDSLIWKGWKRSLTIEDLWTLPFYNRCSSIIPIWDRNWATETKKSRTKKQPVSILTTLIRCFGSTFAWSSILNLLYTVLQFVSPQLVDLLIGYVEKDEPAWRGYLYIMTLFVVTIINTIINVQSLFIQYDIGLRIKTSLISAIYRKSLKLSSGARKVMTVGETTNLMALDAQRFMDVVPFLNMAWTSPLGIILCMYFLWGILGPSSLAGLAVMVLMIPLNGIVAAKMKKYQISMMKEKDKRVKLMDEVLNGMKVLKLYAWEPSFAEQVLGIRSKEIKYLKDAALLNAFTTFLWTCAPVLVALSSFTVFVLVSDDNVLDAQTAFVSLTYFNMLRIPLNFLPSLIVYLVQVNVSLKRINAFMNAEELDPNNVTHDKEFNSPIVAANASFTWDNDEKPVLQDVSCRVDEGSLTAIVGAVGSGKSSLLSAFLGDMKRTKGIVNVFGKIAYVPQQAWIQNSTLQGNITFGKRYNRELYHRVVDSCALGPDLEMLPGGDQTEIGEKGINLSGGQKQRISMARSVYSNGSLYLLDDPLSAVDAHVGKHIFEKVIGPQGLLRNKTRVLVTHGVSFLPEVDKILVMKDGTITETGSYEELLAQKGAFADFLVQYLSEKKEEELDPETESELEEIQKNLEKHLGKKNLERQLSKTKTATAISDLARYKNDSSKKRVVSISEEEEEQGKRNPKVGQNLIETEKAEVGGVSWKVYGYYAKSVGYLSSLSAMVFLFSYQGFQVAGNIWLSKWSDDPLASTQDSIRDMYLGVYGALGLGQGLCIMIGSLMLAIFTLNAASKLHSTLLMRIMRSPMSFFETTPLGRILNRFSKDVDIVDTMIPMNIRLMFNMMMSVSGTVVVIVFALPIFIVVIVPVGIVYYFVQKFYVSTARQVKRLESISRSPIYTHFSESISGASTIRAYDRDDDFILENENRIDSNQICYYPGYVSSRWLSVRLEIIGNIVLMFAALFAVLSRGSINPGSVGLSLSYALNVTGQLNMLVRQSSEVETNMVSVERIKEYQEIVQEAAFDVPENDPGEDWPEHGVIKFDNYQTRYREGLDLVLRGIDCKVDSTEKIGIVGRTGAGKSSLTLALFRIIESAGGSIEIDDVNIAQLGLGKLRSRITIIPQDPVLFAGTMRMNLDPLGKYSDSAIWRALDHAHLKSLVTHLSNGLDHEINEGGSNLSVGQRQLMCLARALLRKTKVLILDEATAAVDLETDDLVQATIRQEFADCTVLTIAHRLNTIMDNNRVMVLDQGRIAEFDTPDNLLADRQSIFYGMAKNAGLVSM